MDSTRPFRIFIRIFEAGSFSAVAKELGVSQSTVSKQLAALETQLGALLFTRTTRQLKPTEEAIGLYEPVRRMLETADAIKSLDRRQSRATGTLRLSLPSAFGRRKIIPLLPEFLALEPDVSLDISLTDRVVDLVAEGIEVAIRLGDLSSSSLVARRIGSYSQYTLATPEYLRKHGYPNTPADLEKHNCIIHGRSGGGRWQYDSEYGHYAIDVNGTMNADDAEAVRDLALADVGIALVPDWIAKDDIDSGRLEVLLTEYFPPVRSIHAVFQQRQFMPPRVQAFLNFITLELDST